MATETEREADPAMRQSDNDTRDRRSDKEARERERARDEEAGERRRDRVMTSQDPLQCSESQDIAPMAQELLHAKVMLQKYMQENEGQYLILACRIPAARSALCQGGAAVHLARSCYLCCSACVVVVIHCTCPLLCAHPQVCVEI